VGEAQEADEMFWGQRAFAEEEDASDTEFTVSSFTSDSSDSDIDAPEPTEADEARLRLAAEAAAKADDDERAVRARRCPPACLPPPAHPRSPSP
jgi:hypothetical protein